MSDWLAVLPSVHPPYTDACLATSKLDPGRVTVVDNTVDNTGVSGSWNLVGDQVVAENRDWLVIISAAVRFGEPGGLDFIAALDQVDPDAGVLEAHILGWKLIAFRARTLVEVGRFDENFHPAYFEDLDYSWRFQLRYGLVGVGHQLWPKTPVDAEAASHAHGVLLAGVEAPADPNIAYYRSKWGGMSGHETHQTPFSEPGRDVTWWPPR